MPEDEERDDEDDEVHSDSETQLYMVDHSSIEAGGPRNIRHP